MLIIEQLEKIFSVKRTDKIAVEQGGKYFCSKCRKKFTDYSSLDHHHIVYPGSKKDIALLCRRCHARITYMNSRAAKRLKRKLLSSERRIVWNHFLKESVDNVKYDSCLQWYKEYCKCLKES